MLHPLGMSFHVLWGFSPTRVQQGRWLLRDLNSTAKWGSPPPSPHSKPQLRANSQPLPEPHLHASSHLPQTLTPRTPSPAPGRPGSTTLPPAGQQRRALPEPPMETRRRSGSGRGARRHPPTDGRRLPRRAAAPEGTGRVGPGRAAPAGKAEEGKK